MFRFILPAILIGIAIAGVFTFTNPLYNQVLDLRTQGASYDDALNNSKALENERDKLTNKYNSLKPEDLDRLQKMLPDNVDNIRLILEIEKVATPYGMVLKDVKYDTEETPTTVTGAQGGGVPANSLKDYGAWNLEFSTQGNYNNFLNFIRDLEKNLRIVDVASIDFSSNVGAGVNPALANIYKYDFKIKTYWLKN